MGNNRAENGDSPTHRSSSRIVCRCCLSEEDEMTDYLPLDSMATTSFREYDDAAVGGESSSSPSSATPTLTAHKNATKTTTLLDCLNGCARIGASLEDTSLPLHICLDCCQALEACCEFIRCVQNADKILRRKRLETVQESQMVSGDVVVNVGGHDRRVAKVVDPKVERETRLVLSIDDGNPADAASKETLPIGSLNLLDLIGDSQMTMLGLDNALDGNDSNNISQTNVIHALNESSNSCSILGTSIEIGHISKDQNSLNPSNVSLHDINVNDFTLSNSSRIQVTPIANSNLETVSMTQLHNDGVPNFLSMDSSVTKDCGDAPAKDNTKPNAQNDIIHAHKFIPPLIKDIKGPTDTRQNQTEKNILETDFLSKTVTFRSNHRNTDVRPSLKSTEVSIDQDEDQNSSINGTNCTTLQNGGRKYIVNAAIANDLRKFHRECQGKHRYFCMFCIFVCDSKLQLDKHLATHLGSPRYHCSECNFESRFKYYLIKHLRKSHNAQQPELRVRSSYEDVSRSWTKFYCSICQCFFTSLIALQQHHHIDEEPCFKCTYCPLKETQRERLMEHMAEEHKVFIDAHLIGIYIPNTTKPMRFREVNKSFLNQFIKFQTKDQKANVHLCQYCGKSFQRRFHVLKHEHYVHPKDKKIADEKFFKRRTTKSARQQYTRHLRAAQAEHQYKCDICRRVFKTHEELVAHAQQHQCSQFQCVTCEAVFAFEFELKYHMRTHNTSTLSSPGYDYHADAKSSINEELKSRLHQLKQQKQNKKLSSLSAKRKPITKRRLSMASVSTTKSSESSLNSPSNTNSDEDMPSALKMSNMQYDIFDSVTEGAISVADVMLPQPFQRNTLRRLSSSSSNYSLNKLCATTSSPPFIQSQGPSCIAEKNFHFDSSDQTYLNDFDLNLLDCSEDFLLDFPSL